jgi:sirohydrochlorin ferrochelatase
MKAILIIDHGSVRKEANEMLACVANLLAHMAGNQAIVHFAHMELAEPGVADGIAACVRDGADHVVVFPYMLSPGKHSTGDIPRMVGEVAASYPAVTFEVTPCFGVESELAQVILRRAGVGAADKSPPTRCWNPTDNAHACGSACLEHQTN